MTAGAGRPARSVATTNSVRSTVSGSKSASDVASSWSTSSTSRTSRSWWACSARLTRARWNSAARSSSPVPRSRARSVGSRWARAPKGIGLVAGCPTARLVCASVKRPRTSSPRRVLPTPAGPVRTTPPICRSPYQRSIRSSWADRAVSGQDERTSSSFAERSAPPVRWCGLVPVGARMLTRETYERHDDLALIPAKIPANGEVCHLRARAWARRSASR